MVKPLTNADTMSSMPKAHEAADEVASGEDIETEWSAKLLIVVDEKSWYTKVMSEGEHMHMMSAMMANSM